MSQVVEYRVIGFSYYETPATPVKTASKGFYLNTIENYPPAAVERAGSGTRGSFQSSLGMVDYSEHSKLLPFSISLDEPAIVQVEQQLVPMGRNMVLQGLKILDVKPFKKSGSVAPGIPK